MEEQQVNLISDQYFLKYYEGKKNSEWASKVTFSTTYLKNFFHSHSLAENVGLRERVRERR